MIFYKTELGKDCVNLDESLCLWLGERLVEWSKHVTSCPCEYSDPTDWRRDLLKHGSALLEYAKVEEWEDFHVAKAKSALYFVTEHLTQLWE